jgi:hypothetical protein
MIRTRILILLVVVLSACDAPPPAPLIAAKLTADHAVANAAAAEAQATLDAAQVSYRATVQASDAQATAQAHAGGVIEATRTVVQATLDASAIAEAQARVDVARIQITAQAAEAQLKTLAVVSMTNSVSVTQIAQATELNHKLAREDDFFWNVWDYLSKAAGPLLGMGAAILALYAGYVIVRALAVRLSGVSGNHQMAALVLGYAASPTALLAAPRDAGEHGETRNTGYTEYTNDNTDDGVYPVYSNGPTRYAPRLTDAEFAQLRHFKSRATSMLLKSIEYNDQHSLPDNKIPRHNKIGMKPEDRGEICDALERVGAVLIRQGGNNQGTEILEPYATCQGLLDALISGSLRIVPLGFNTAALRRAEILNSAVNRLPESPQEITA